MQLRAIIIGSGNAATWHAYAFLKANFVLHGVLSKKGSNTVGNFASMFDIPKIYSDINEVIKCQNDWDVAVVTCPTEFSLKYVDKLNTTGKPILAEKPVSYSLSDLEYLSEFNNIKIAFNRRFYDTVVSFKDNLIKEGYGKIRVNIPERTSSTNHSPGLLPYLVYENSIHIFDILNFCFGEIEWQFASSVASNKEEIISVSSIGTSNNYSISLDMSFNSPENFSISSFLGSKKMELKPIETLSIIEGMNIQEPSQNHPLRTYNPNIISQSSVLIRENIKPGILEQAKSFMRFAKGKQEMQLATARDALNAIRSIKEIENLL